MALLVVVVEDDPSTRELMVAILDEGGYASLALDNGDGAVEVVKAVRPAALILDLVLRSSLSGWEVLAQLEHETTVCQVPTLVCSADAWALRDRAPQLLARGIGVLEKPFLIDELLRWLHERCPAPIDQTPHR